MLAQSFFCLVAVIALVTSKFWSETKAVADGDTVLRLVLVPPALAPVELTDAVTPLPAWLDELDVAAPPPVAAGDFPPEASKRMMTAATPHAATPAPPAMSRRRVNGEPTGRPESGSG